MGHGRARDLGEWWSWTAGAYRVEQEGRKKKSQNVALWLEMGIGTFSVRDRGIDGVRACDAYF